MADNSFRGSRRDAYSSDVDTQGGSDPLAELARLIGQSESYRGGSRDAAQPYDEGTPLPELD